MQNNWKKITIEVFFLGGDVDIFNYLSFIAFLFVF